MPRNIDVFNTGQDTWNRESFLLDVARSQFADRTERTSEGDGLVTFSRVVYNLVVDCISVVD